MVVNININVTRLLNFIIYDVERVWRSLWGGERGLFGSEVGKRVSRSALSPGVANSRVIPLQCHNSVVLVADCHNTSSMRGDCHDIHSQKAIVLFIRRMKWEGLEGLPSPQDQPLHLSVYISRSRLYELY